MGRMPYALALLSFLLAQQGTQPKIQQIAPLSAGSCVMVLAAGAWACAALDPSVQLVIVEGQQPTIKAVAVVNEQTDELKNVTGTAALTLSKPSPSNIKVFRNGLKQAASNGDYSLSGAVITFAGISQATDFFQAVYNF